MMDVEGLCQYLTLKSIPYDQVTPLEGGAVNYIWRVRASGSSSIIKYATHHLRKNVQFIVSVDRMDYEVQAIQDVPKLLHSTDSNHLHIDLPAMIRYDAEKHILQISDGGSRNLQSAFADPTLEMQVLGARLGHWLARLHNVTSSAAVLPTIKRRFNNAAGKSIYRTNFNGLEASLDKFGYDPQLGSRMNARFGTLLGTDQVCLCHGDFWPANVIVEDSDQNNSSPSLMVIDWELTRIGNGATDVGQFIAEAWILETFKASKTSSDSLNVNERRGLVKPFLEAYLAERPLSDEDRLRVAAQFGTHLAYLPGIVAYPAGSRQPTEMMSMGNHILQLVDAGDVASLKRSILWLLFNI